MMTSTYLILVGADEMLGLGSGVDPAAAVEDFYESLDTYGATPGDVSERFSVSTMRLRDDLAEPVGDLILEHAEDALPAIEDLVKASGTTAPWQVVNVVMESGDRTASLRD